MNRILALQELTTKLTSQLLANSDRSNVCSSESGHYCSSQSVHCPNDDTSLVDW